MKREDEMPIPVCGRETEVIAAVADGRWSEELAAHAESCPACADTARVERLLRTEEGAALAEAAERLPTADEIWHRARSEQRRRAIDRALLPIRWIERLAGVAAAWVTVMAIGWGGSFLGPLVAPLREPLATGWERILGAFASASAVTPSAEITAQPSPQALAVGLAGLALAALAAGVYRLWSER